MKFLCLGLGLCEISPFHVDIYIGIIHNKKKIKGRHKLYEFEMGGCLWEGLDVGKEKRCNYTLISNNKEKIKVRVNFLYS